MTNEDVVAYNDGRSDGYNAACVDAMRVIARHMSGDKTTESLELLLMESMEQDSISAMVDSSCEAIADDDFCLSLDLSPESLLWVRKLSGQKRSEVCRATGISKEFLKGIETGRENPSVESLRALARHYKVDIIVSQWEGLE